MRFPAINTLHIHVPKTGGTTITNAILRKLYPKKANNSSIPSLYHDKELSVVNKVVNKAHVFASEYRGAMGFKEYNRHYTFALTRNPFEQIRSLYSQLTYMNIEQNPRFIPYKTMTFEEFVMGDGENSMVGNDDLIDQLKYITDTDGKTIIVDDVFPFDHYRKVLAILEKKLGLPISANKVFRKTNNVGDCYTPEMASRVVDLYGHVYELHKKIKKDFEANVLSKD